MPQPGPVGERHCHLHSRIFGHGLLNLSPAGMRVKFDHSSLKSRGALQPKMANFSFSFPSKKYQTREELAFSSPQTACSPHEGNFPQQNKTQWWANARRLLPSPSDIVQTHTRDVTAVGTGTAGSPGQPPHPEQKPAGLQTRAGVKGVEGGDVTWSHRRASPHSQKGRGGCRAFPPPRRGRQHPPTPPQTVSTCSTIKSRSKGNKVRSDFLLFSEEQKRPTNSTSSQRKEMLLKMSSLIFSSLSK